jgi:endonuclease/exonuclease/phosphatase (EEP) superfamily protein YafD
MWAAAPRGLRLFLMVLALIGIVATALPLMPTDAWWVRILDYPRLQFSAAMLAVMIALLLLSPRTRTTWIIVACLIMALGWNAALLGPYLLPWSRVEIATSQECPADHRLRILSVNVQMTNRRDHRLLDLTREANPDIAWFQETNAWWEDELSSLSASMPHGVSQAQSNYFGVHLFSRLPLHDADVRYLTGSRNPSVFATATLPSGDRVKLYAIHPRPPLIGQGTGERDAQMMAMAREASADSLPHLVMGDLNTVPWEGIAARMKRIGSFRDPRAGRGLFITWKENSRLLKWPLDHIMAGPDWTLVSLEVLPGFGSDHLPILAELCLEQ